MAIYTASMTSELGVEGEECLTVIDDNQDDDSIERRTVSARMILSLIKSNADLSQKVMELSNQVSQFIIKHDDITMPQIRTLNDAVLGKEGLCNRMERAEEKIGSTQREVTDYKKSQADACKERKETYWRWTDTVFSIFLAIIALMQYLHK